MAYEKTWLHKSAKVYRNTVWKRHISSRLLITFTCCISSLLVMDRHSLILRGMWKYIQGLQPVALLLSRHVESTDHYEIYHILNVQWMNLRHEWKSLKCLCETYYLGFVLYKGSTLCFFQVRVLDAKTKEQLCFLDKVCWHSAVTTLLLLFLLRKAQIKATVGNVNKNDFFCHICSN